MDFQRRLVCHSSPFKDAMVGRFMNVSGDSDEEFGSTSIVANLEHSTKNGAVQRCAKSRKKKAAEDLQRVASRYWCTIDWSNRKHRGWGQSRACEVT